MKKILVITTFLFLISTPSYALKGQSATEQNIKDLKRDIVSGKIAVGKTRLKDVRRLYGEARNININDRRVTYDYGDLKIDFSKQKIWKKWEYDSFKDQAYTDDVDDLRFDLESQELVGSNITAARILKDYGDPTEVVESSEDGEWTIYYYGDIKLSFMNHFVVSNFKGNNLEDAAVSSSITQAISTESIGPSSQLK